MWPLSRKTYFGKQVGKYIIEKPIGEGRYGVCFLAKTDTYNRVVIKKFKKSIFKRKIDSNVYEAVILSKLSDNGIPEFLGVINEKGFYAFVLEFKNGFTVEDLIFKYKYKFTNKEFFDIGFKLIKLIKYIHENGVVHRDIRIPNVLIDKGELYLIDFGLARWVDKNKYPYDLDFSYLGEFLLYLLYSSFETKEKHKKLPWYKELNLTNKQKLFLKKLLGLEKVYKNIEDIKMDFTNVFGV
ncbi:protein kinase family protein [Clostridium estertheticum]|uniref:protein kinase family protein n=1 Tax=Clostridium estertheticum TaxID=238834 RepID=UPI001CF23D7E|nr:protein kinase family protein [Clostridium estertheticum]MCB2305809.1 protein kinase family protein [Clostridium estertheticum]MCB2344222.1 protein kinase family protein [Clostridium estertheticum]MCB2348164.1 protein kinase family protein [Clostridium estertheticum]WAG45801.1 protein kinase family protein [Clostridium estertheticum]